MAKRKQAKVPSSSGIAYDAYRITSTGKVVFIEQTRCGSCNKQFPFEDVDPDDDEAWPDEDTWLCEGCRWGAKL